MRALCVLQDRHAPQIHDALHKVRQEAVLGLHIHYKYPSSERVKDTFILKLTNIVKMSVQVLG